MSDSNSSLELFQSDRQLEKQLLEESDPVKIKEIINLFNLNLKKKEIIRTTHLSSLQDKVFSQLDKRLSEKPDNFSNTDLINYYKVFADQITRADTALENINVPRIQINQQINVTGQSPAELLSRESREKVISIVKDILNSTNEKTPAQVEQAVEVLEEGNSDVNVED